MTHELTGIRWISEQERLLLADPGGGMITIMGRDRAQQATSDRYIYAFKSSPRPIVRHRML
jgi:hypothetical protein